MNKICLDNKINRTKIIATIGPSTHSEKAIEKLFYSGMTTVRLNFSHGNYEEQGDRIIWTKKIIKKIGKPISILLDTKGPEIRIGKIKNKKQTIKLGAKITIFTTLNDYITKEGAMNEITTSYDISSDLKIGDIILIDDGKLQLNVENVYKGVVIARALNYHILETNKRINLPGIHLSLPFLSEKDKDDIKYGIQQKIDYIAVSFVNNAKNVDQIKNILKENNASHIQIIAKIESQIGIKNINEIIKVSDGIMIARGDLGLEIPYYDVPYWEKIIIRKCREMGKIVIVATQMLESMTNNLQPTRAEVTDVYFATELGADATMLSGESANGVFPFVAAKTMSIINQKAEHEFYSKLYYKKHLKDIYKNINEHRIKIAYKLAEKCKNGKYEYAVVVSNTGKLLKIVSKFRPNVVILGVTPIKELYTAFGLWHSIFMNKVDNYVDFKNDYFQINVIAKKWGAKKGSKILYVRNEELKEIIIK